jgi:tetratricopeptide (TPR) repeat protein
VASGTILGLPVRVLELASLPALDETVLLDLDADYFGTADAASQRPTYLPPRPVSEVMERLAELGLRSDLATLCNSNVGGFLPIESRGMADETWLWLTEPEAARLLATETGPELRAGRERLLRGEASLAADLLRSLREMRPADPSLAFLHSRALQEAGDERGAAETLADAVAADPAYAGAKLSRADTLYLSGSWAEALTLYRELAETEDAGLAGYARRRTGNCLYHLGRVAEAEEAFREVTAAHPGHADTWADLAVCLLDQGRFPEGTAALEEAARRDPANGEHARKLAAVYQQQGRAEEALRSASRALSLRPGDPLCRVDYGLLLGMSGQLEEARSHAQLAAQLDPQSPRAFLLLGELALRSGRPQAAVASFREALRLDPGNQGARAALQEAQRRR